MESCARPAPRGRFSLLLRRIGKFQSTLFLTLLYFLLWLPAGMLARLGADWLHVKAPRQTHWWPRADRLNQPAHVHDPF